MIGAAHLGLVVVFARVDSEDLVSLHLAVGPAFGVRKLPAIESIFEVFTEDKRKFGFGFVR